MKFKFSVLDIYEGSINCPTSLLSRIDDWLARQNDADNVMCEVWVAGEAKWQKAEEAWSGYWQACELRLDGDAAYELKNMVAAWLEDCDGRQWLDKRLDEKAVEMPDPKELHYSTHPLV